MGPFFYIIIIMLFRLYEAKRLDNHQWITEAEKQFSWLASGFLIVVAAESLLQVPGLILFTMGFSDLFLNWQRKGIDTWHLGKDAKWDRFWSARPKSYKVMRYTTIIVGITLIVLSYFIGEPPVNYLYLDYEDAWFVIGRY